MIEGVMKIFLKMASVAVFALCTLFYTSQSHAKLPSPPAQLTGIFMDFAEFEAAFKNDKWEDARRATAKISEKFNQMLPQLKNEIKSDPEKTFQGIISNISQSVKSQDKDKTEKLFIELHKFVLSLISNYNYKTPPIFIIINKYIAEAEEALEKKRYDRVISEVEEITFLFTFAENHLESRDTRRKQIEEIRVKLREINSAATYKKSDAVKSGIKTLKKMLSDFIKPS
jgi:hypothetical protein